MIIELHTISRDNLYEAKALYVDGKVTVKKGSRINIRFGKGFKPSNAVKEMLDDHTLYDEEGVLLRELQME